MWIKWIVFFCATACPLLWVAAFVSTPLSLLLPLLSFLYVHLRLLLDKTCKENRMTSVYAHKHIAHYPTTAQEDRLQEASASSPNVRPLYASFLSFSFFFFSLLLHLSSPPRLVGKTGIKFLWPRGV